MENQLKNLDESEENHESGEKVLYRYERYRLCDLEIRMRCYKVVKTTNCGFWIYDYVNYKNRFVLKAEGRALRRYAFETKRQAWENFKKRTEKSIKYCRQNLRTAESVLGAINKAEENRRIDNKIKVNETKILKAYGL